MLSKKGFIALLLVSAFAIQGCSKSNNQVNAETTLEKETEETITENEELELSVTKLSIHENETFGGVIIDKTIEEFNALGYEYGDSVDVIFSNGYELKDVPYYDGFYAKVGDQFLLAYPGYGNIEARICSGDSLWDVAKLKEGDTVSISRREKGKYLDKQNLLKINYTDKREDYSSDEVFANFRNVKVGNLKENILYRGASPIDNSHNRAKYVDGLIEKANIKYDVDLSDNENKIKEHFAKDDFSSDYFKKLYDDGKVSLLSMNMNYRSKAFEEKIVKALTDMSKNEGPYYIHCVEGKDRTGFLCMVIEGLLGASYEEMVNDYMITYEDYYGVEKNANKEKWDALIENNIDDMLKSIAEKDPYTGNGTIALDELDWVNVMGRFLSKNGMSDEDIENLYDKLGSNDYTDPD